MISLLERGALALAAALCLAVLGGWLAPLGLVASPTRPIATFGWLADTASNFQLLYALGFAAVLAVLAARRRWRSLAAIAPFAISVAIQLWPYFGPGLPVAQAVAAVGRPQELRVAALNVWFLNPHIDVVRRWIAETDADVVVLSEVTPELRQALAPALAGYPWQAMSQGQTRADVLLASRVPVEFVPLAADTRDYMVEARLCPREDGARCAWVIGAHVPSPVSPRRLMHRDRLLAEIGNLAAAAVQSGAGEPVIVAGDLNSTPWVPGFRTMLARGTLVDSAEGHGIWPTWNTRLFIAQIPIDHVLVGGPVAVLGRAVGPDVGSDHLPVTARLRF
jgi:endonuclease/exonuclease/phosphatase (EEP) superfamily protein YafD